MNNKLDLIAISDIHGSLPDICDKFDILTISGDISPVWTNIVEFQEEWFLVDFLNWLTKLPYKDEDSKVIIIPGNHDFFLENLSEEKRKLYDRMIGLQHGILLINEEIELTFGERSIKIFGTPYCKKFYNWAFMEELDKIGKYYEEIPEKVDILLTHDAPDINGLGVINDGKYKGVNAGNKVLAEYIEKKAPKYCFCGHIHSGNHDIFEYNGTIFANVSYMDEEYNKRSNSLLKIKI